MSVIELENYTLAPFGSGKGIKQCCFSLSKGDVVSVFCELPDDAYLFLKALAMFVYPLKGAYRFMGKNVDFSNRATLLSCKKKIGYISLNSAMMSNRTIRYNLLFMRYYFENSFSIDLDDNTSRLCDIFNIHDKLDMRPSELDPINLRIAIAIREFSKNPAMLLLERPEEFIGHNRFDLFVEILQETLLSDVPVVFFSRDVNFIKKFANRKIFVN